MPSESTYPSAIDSYTLADIQADEQIKSEHMRKALDAAIAVETALGLTPQGSAADLAARLGTILALTSGIQVGSGHSVGSTNTGLVVLGASHTVGDACNQSVVMGYDHNVGSGALRCAVFGEGHTLGSGCVYGILSGYGQTIGNSTNSFSIFGNENIVGSSCGYPSVFGYQNSIGNSTGYMTIFGTGNSLSDGQFFTVLGASNTLAQGQFIFCFGSDNNLTQGPNYAVVFGQGVTSNSGSEGFAVFTDSVTSQPVLAEDKTFKIKYANGFKIEGGVSGASANIDRPSQQTIVKRLETTTGSTLPDPHVIYSYPVPEDSSVVVEVRKNALSIGGTGAAVGNSSSNLVIFKLKNVSGSASATSMALQYTNDDTGMGGALLMPIVNGSSIDFTVYGVQDTIVRWDVIFTFQVTTQPAS